MSEILFLVGAGVFVLLGVAHGLLTLRDLRAPRSFTPTDEHVRRAMADTPLRLAPQTTMWDSWLGFNLSHSLGLVVFGAVFGVLAWRDFGMVGATVFLPFSAVVVALIYVLLALRFWFWVPALMSAVGALCFILSALSD